MSCNRPSIKLTYDFYGFLFLLMLLLTVSIKQGYALDSDMSGRNVMTSGGAACNLPSGSTNDYSAFSFLDTGYGAPAGAIVIPAGMHCLIGISGSSTSLTLYHPLKFMPGSTLKVGAGFTLTLAVTPIASDSEQIFDTSSSGIVYIRHPVGYGGFLIPPIPSINTHIPLAWFGGNVTAADNAPALNAAVQALASTTGGTIEIDAGIYHISCPAGGGNAVAFQGSYYDSTSHLIIDYPVGMKGRGTSETNLVIDNCAGKSAFYIAQKHLSGNFSDMSINNSETNHTGSPATATIFDYEQYTYMGTAYGTNGNSEMRNLRISNAGTAINCGVCQDMNLEYIAALSCGHTCIKFDGLASDSSGSQSVAIIRLEFSYLEGLSEMDTNASIDIDTGANSINMTDVTVGSAKYGIYVHNTYWTNRGHRPEGILINNLVSDTAQYNVYISSVWGFQLNMAYFGRSAFNGIALNSKTGDPSAVDGIYVSSSVLRGAGNDGIIMDSACNLFVTASTVYDNNISAASYSGIHATANSCGTLSILGNTLGVEESADAGNRQKYSVTLDAGSLNTVTTCGQPTSPVTCVGRGIIIGNGMQGNTTGGLLNSGPAASGANLQILNNTGYNPQPATVVTCATPPSCTHASGPAGEVDVVSGAGVTSVSVAGTTVPVSSGSFPLKPGQSLIVNFATSAQINVFPQ